MRGASFLRRTFGRRSALMRGEEDRFCALTTAVAGGFESLEDASWIDAATVDEHEQQREFRASFQALPQLHEAGMTLCADVSGKPAVAEVLEAMRVHLRSGAGRGFAKLYWSPPSKGFAIHFDPQHVFVVQLVGSKRWWFADAPAVAWAANGAYVDRHGTAVWAQALAGHPVTAPDGGAVAAPTRAQLREEVLTPGDVLYLPPGTWHTTAAETDSRALSLSPARLSAGQVLLDLVASRLAHDERWSQDLASGGVSEGALAASLRSLAATVAQLHPSQVSHAWHSQVYAPPQPREPTAVAPADIEPDTAFVRAAEGELHRVVVRAADGTVLGLSLFGDGASAGLPPSAGAFVEGLRRTTRFTARQAMGWDPQLTWEATQAALSGLVEAGLLERLSPRAG